MDTTNQLQIINQLKDIINNDAGTIRAEVAKEALSYGNQEVLSFFKDLFAHGCVSGMISSLVYYRDTFAFFDRFYDEIEELRVAYLEETGQPLQMDGDLKNGLAWFAFEETARRIADELDICV